MLKIKYKVELMVFMAYVIFASSAFGQGLPRCVGTDTAKWNKCIGASEPNSKITYSGEFNNGVPNGIGELNFENGNKIKGQFQNGKFTGNGHITARPDDSGYGYIGELRNGEFHGYGKRFADNLIYEGEFKNGKWDGRGSVVHDGGKYKYEGNFSNGKQNGFGKLTVGNVIFSGIFKDDKPTGEFEINYPDGQRYAGEINDFRPHGRGVLFSSSGSITYSGNWSSGRPLKNETAKGDGTDDDKTCQKYGLSVGTSDYADCRIKISRLKQDAEIESRNMQRLIELQEEDRRARVEAQNRSDSDALIRFGLDMLGGKTRFSEGYKYLDGQGAPNTTSNLPRSSSVTRSITLPNGTMVTCTTFQSMTNCF